MDRKEKNARKAQLSKYMNLANGRFRDDEIEYLESLVENRNSFDGESETYRSSYKTFDSQDTYHVDEEETFTFRSDESGIRIERDFERKWDDGQNDTEHNRYDTARGILNSASKIFKKRW